MLSLKDVEMSRERFNDYRRESQHDRLVEQALAVQTRRPSVLTRVLTWLGQLVTIKSSPAQVRVGSLSPAALSSTSQPRR